MKPAPGALPCPPGVYGKRIQHHGQACQSTIGWLILSPASHGQVLVTASAANCEHGQLACGILCCAGTTPGSSDFEFTSGIAHLNCSISLKKPCIVPACKAPANKHFPACALGSAGTVNHETHPSAPNRTFWRRERHCWGAWQHSLIESCALGRHNSRINDRSVFLEHQAPMQRALNTSRAEGPLNGRVYLTAGLAHEPRKVAIDNAAVLTQETLVVRI